MSNGLLLDTHVALWLDSGSEHLKPGTRDLIDTCWRTGGTIYLSAVSSWEIASAIELGCPFVTYDDRILRFGRARGREYGFALAE